MTISDSSIVRRFTIKGHEFRYSFLGIRSFAFKLIDLMVSISLTKVILDMIRNNGYSSEREWALLLFVWVLMKFYYVYNSFTHIAEYHSKEEKLENLDNVELWHCNSCGKEFNDWIYFDTTKCEFCGSKDISIKSDTKRSLK